MYNLGEKWEIVPKKNICKEHSDNDGNALIIRAFNQGGYDCTELCIECIINERDKYIKELK